MCISDDEGVARLIELARHEDLGDGDVSTNLLDAPGETSSFRLIAREAGVFAGREIALAVVRAYDRMIDIAWSGRCGDGARVDEPPVELALIRGPLGPVLSAERVLLNFLQRLCGVATLTRAFVDAVEGTGVSVYDTRKTTPGWRRLEKYAVRCGGGCNHRFGLHDAVLLKDNHLSHVGPDRLAGTVFEMLNRLSAGGIRPKFVEIEADALDQVAALLKVVGVDVILLDNFSPDELREAVAMRNAHAPRSKIIFEASGGITLNNVRAIAETGVERVSVGAITHAAVAVDLSLERS